MKSTTSIFSTEAVAGRRSADLQLAWLDAADDVQEAYLAWRDADRADRVDGFVVYSAALDREEAAARALQLQLRPQKRRVRSS